MAEKFWEYVAHGLIVGGVLGSLMRVFGRPFLFNMLNGRYETKTQAEERHKQTIDRIDQVEENIGDKVGGVDKRLDQIAGILMHR